MTSIAHNGLRAVAGLVLMAAIAQVGRLERGTSADHSQLRIAVRTRASSADRCRERTAEELQKLPVHMRQKMVCERDWIAYGFEVQLDGGTVDQRTVAPAGAFGDRPLVLSSQTPVAAGAHSVRVVLSPQVPSDLSAPVSQLSFERTLQFQSGHAVLVSLDTDGDWKIVGASTSVPE